MRTWRSSVADSSVTPSRARTGARSLLLGVVLLGASSASADDSTDAEPPLSDAAEEAIDEAVSPATIEDSAATDTFTIEDEIDTRLELGGTVPPGPASETGLQLDAPSTAPEYIPAEGTGKKKRVPLTFEVGGALTFEQQFLRAAPPLGDADTRDFNFTGVGYHLRGYLGRRFGFLFDLAFLMPLRGHQAGPDGTDIKIRKTYDKALGGDVLTAFAFRDEFGGKWTYRVGGGPHLSAFRFDDPDLLTFEHLALGVAATADLVMDIREHFHIGGQTTVAVDFVDLIHDTGKLKYMVAWHIGILAGVRFP